MKSPVARFALACALFALAAPAGAQTVYKLIDRNGKVTYSEEPPKEFDGKVIRIDIDPNRNRATLGVHPQAGSPSAPANASPPSVEERLEQARQRLEDRRKELADAREHPREDEIRWVGNVGGGTRAVPTEAYQQRIASLERAVKEADDEVRELEKGR